MNTYEMAMLMRGDEVVFNESVRMEGRTYLKGDVYAVTRNSPVDPSGRRSIRFDPVSAGAWFDHKYVPEREEPIQEDEVKVVREGGGVATIAWYHFLDPRTDVLEDLYQGKFIRVRSLNGWEYAERVNCTGVVVVSAVTKEDNMLFVEQQRPPVGGPVIELPAGLVGDDDSEEGVIVAASRELVEETGYKPGSIKVVGSGPVSPGMSSEVITLVAATNVVKVSEGGGVENENILVHEVPCDEVASWLQARSEEGKMVDFKVWALAF